MTDLSDRMVEAGARAIAAMQFGGNAERWDLLSQYQQDDCRTDSRACLTAALALAEAEGVRDELERAAMAWQDTIRPDKADRTANISKEERALFFAVEKLRATLAGKVTP